MSEFHIGQKVVCVDDVTHGRYTSHPITKHDLDGLKEKSIYTIAGMPAEWGAVTLVLVEIIRQRSHPNDYRGFAQQRFRPLEYKAMSIFRAIAANPKIKIRESA